MCEELRDSFLDHAATVAEGKRHLRATRTKPYPTIASTA